MYLIPAQVALLAKRESVVNGSRRILSSNRPLFWLIWVALTIIIGFRYQVGGDWDHYISAYYALRDASIYDIIVDNEPGYALMNWISGQFDFGIVGVNLIGATIFSFGLVYFCSRLPRPWLALTVAIPYLVIVVAMGYTRQGVAIGLAMLGLVGLIEGSNRKFIAALAIAVTIHKSALLLLPLATLINGRNRYWALLWMGAIGVILFYLFLAKSTDDLYNNYIVAEYQSEGAFIRLALNAVAAAFLLLFRNRFEMSDIERRTWLILSGLALGLFGLYFVTSASTALDRMALYFLPLQLVVFAHLPDAMSRGKWHGRLWTRVSESYRRRAPQWPAIAIVAVYGLIQFVWLNYAYHSHFWLPYSLYFD